VLDSNDKKVMDKAREEAVKPIEKAKQVVRDAVGGFTGGPAFAEYDMEGSLNASKPGKAVALSTAPADFDGSM
jgi:hypothetical protein